MIVLCVLAIECLLHLYMFLHCLILSQWAGWRLSICIAPPHLLLFVYMKVPQSKGLLFKLCILAWKIWTLMWFAALIFLYDWSLYLILRIASLARGHMDGCSCVFLSIFDVLSFNFCFHLLWSYLYEWLEGSDSVNISTSGELIALDCVVESLLSIASHRPPLFKASLGHSWTLCYVIAFVDFWTDISMIYLHWLHKH